MPLERAVNGGAAASELLRRTMAGSGPAIGGVAGGGLAGSGLAGSAPPLSAGVPGGWHDHGWRWLGSNPASEAAGPEDVSMRTKASHLAVDQLAMRRSAEVLAALSAGLDAAERRPDGHAVRTAYLATRLAEELSLAEPRHAELLYAGLLLDAGSTGLEARDHAATAAAATRASWSPLGRWTVPAASASESPHLSRTRRAAAMIHLLGLPAGVSEAVTSVDERWDGRGPRHQRHATIPLGGRILAVASAAAQVGPGAQPSAIERILRGARGRELDPELVDHALRMGRLGLWADLGSADLVERMLALEPEGLVRLSDEPDLDTIAGAFADMIDTRTPRMGRHGRRVAEFAERTGAELGLEAQLQTDLRRAGLLHDIGKLLVPITFLEKPAELTDAERAVVEEHARTGAAILQRSRAFATLGPLVVAHHERLDGYGMFPVIKDEGTAVASRVLALCDRYEAMTAERPYRPLLATEQVWTILDEVVGEPLARVALRAMRRAVPSR